MKASTSDSNTRQGKGSSNFKTTALALALLGVAYLTSTGEPPMVPAATAESVPTAVVLSNDWQYFPDLFVNQGTEFEESYIEQF